MPHSGTKQKNLSDWIDPIFRAPGAIPELFYLTEFFLKNREFLGQECLKLAG